MKQLLTLLFLVVCMNANAVVNSAAWTNDFKDAPQVQAISPDMANMGMEKFLTLTPKEYKRMTGKKLGLKNTIKMKMAQKFIKKQMKKEADIPKGVYILLAILGWGFLAIGLITGFNGNEWWIALLLGFLCWLPGVIYSLVKMKNYY